MSMNIQSVQAFDAAVGKLGAIKGDVTSDQLSELQSLFSSQIWNTSDTQGTKANLERQIKELEKLLAEIEAEIEELYNQQKASNNQMQRLVNDLMEESLQATNKADEAVEQREKAVDSATEEAYSLYMQGKIEKEEIPLKIAELTAKSCPSGSSAMKAHLENMDVTGQKITSISDKIANVLDSVNELTAKFKTTEASLGLMKDLLAKVPEHKERPDIESTMQKPVFTPTQEALGDKLIDAFKVGQTAGVGDASEATELLKTALGTPVTEERKQQLDAMSAEEKSAAVENCDLENFTALELMYLSGMDKYQAGSAIGNIFNGTYVGYNEENGKITVPLGHEGVAGIFRNLEADYATLWGGEFERGSEDDKGNKGGADPFSWRDGDTTFTLAIDRDKDGKFDGPNEFVGAMDGWKELEKADTDGDGNLTAKEMEEAGFSVMENNQALTGGGAYGWNGIDESGVKSIDLKSFKQISDIKSTNLNGNIRAAEFNVVLEDKNGDGVDDVTLGKQTLNTEEYNNMFYSHTYGEAFSFGLDPNEVAETLAAAAAPKNYTEAEESQLEEKLNKTENLIESTEKEVENKEAEANSIRGTATGSELEDKKDEEETATNVTDNTSTTTTESDDYVEEENPPVL